MIKLGLDKCRDELLLIARLLLVLLFVVFGWHKLIDFSGTAGYMAATGAPIPAVSAVVAIAMEFFVSIFILLGIWTRTLAALLMFYTLATAIIGHHYWTMSGAEQYENMINFYKNISIMGGLLLLCVTGAGKYAIDRKLGIG